MLSPNPPFPLVSIVNIHKTMINKAMKASNEYIYCHVTH